MLLKLKPEPEKLEVTYNSVSFGKIEGKKGKEKQNILWMDNIQEWLKRGKLEELVKIARGIKKYRTIANRKALKKI